MKTKINNQMTKIKKPYTYVIVIFGIWFLIFGFLTGCTPTYPKESVREAIIDLCKREYDLTVDATAMGNTVAVYLPAENLFDEVFNLDGEASDKLNDVILTVSRVTLSTDAAFEFYVVIAQDPNMPEVEIVYIRYVDDVKRFLLGDVSRGEYSQRAVIAIKTPPQAEREMVLKELFSQLQIEDTDEAIQELLRDDGEITGIGEISYWKERFFLKEIDFSEFLASQIEERIKIAFREDRQLNTWYEIKMSEGRFVKQGPEGNFIFNVDIADRVAPLYLNSGVAWGAEKKRLMVFEKLLRTIANILWSYKFEGFSEVECSIPMEKKTVTKEELWGLRRGRIKIEELMHLSVGHQGGF